MGRKYQAPPVVEAVCEFRFAPGQPWDWTIPGLMYDKIKGAYPKKKQQNLMELQFQAKAEEAPPQVTGGIAKMQFLNDAETALVQVGPDMLAVNHLRPYPEWTKFKDMLFSNLEVYKQVALPKGVSRIGLRYINRVEIPSRTFLLPDYFNAFPLVPNPIPQRFAQFIQRTDIDYPDAQGQLRLILGTAPETNDKVCAFMFDLDFYTNVTGVLKMDEIVPWVDRAHTELEKAFVACFTDKTHTEIFKEVHR
jgi:uncharacterized protein (TIGR04255 family)